MKVSNTGFNNYASYAFNIRVETDVPEIKNVGLSIKEEENGEIVRTLMSDDEAGGNSHHE